MAFLVGAVLTLGVLRSWIEIWEVVVVVAVGVVALAATAIAREAWIIVTVSVWPGAEREVLLTKSTIQEVLKTIQEVLENVGHKLLRQMKEDFRQT